ncbi:hypothetical protein ACFLW0_02885 [Chloroflexota bacterium]
MSNEEILETIKKQLGNHEKRISELETPLQTRPQRIEKKVSIKEFLLTKKPSGFAKKVVAVGYYLENYEGFDCFNVKDLESWFRSAKEPPPKNMNDAVNGNIGQGYIMEAGKEKDNVTAWILTKTGEDYVESGFEKKK